VSRSVGGLTELRLATAEQQAQQARAELRGSRVLGDLPILYRLQVEQLLSRCRTFRDQLRRVARVMPALEKEPVRSTPLEHSSTSPWNRWDPEAGL
jgi:hypothetical protein